MSRFLVCCLFHFPDRRSLLVFPDLRRGSERDDLLSSSRFPQLELKNGRSCNAALLSLFVADGANNNEVPPPGSRPAVAVMERRKNQGEECN